MIGTEGSSVVVRGSFETSPSSSNNITVPILNYGKLLFGANSYSSVNGNVVQSGNASSLDINIFLIL